MRDWAQADGRHTIRIHKQAKNKFKDVFATNTSICVDYFDDYLNDLTLKIVKILNMLLHYYF